jgi:hypothetical protein
MLKRPQPFIDNKTANGIRASMLATNLAARADCH